MYNFAVYDSTELVTAALLAVITLTAAAESCCSWLLTLLSLMVCQDLTNIDLFLASREVEDALEQKDTSKCLAWCSDNKSRLKKMKVMNYAFLCLFLFICFWTFATLSRLCHSMIHFMDRFHTSRLGLFACM